MPRFRNRASGVVVNVDDATAASLGDEWEKSSAGQATPEKPKRGRPKKETK